MDIGINTEHVHGGYKHKKTHKSHYNKKHCSPNKYKNTLSCIDHDILLKIANIFNKFYNANNSNADKIIMDDSDIAGEGEHKIMYYLKNKGNNDNINIVYGLDADLIHLSLIRENKIYLLRERTEYNFEKIDSEFVFLDISKLKKYLVQDIDSMDDWYRAELMYEAVLKSS